MATLELEIKLFQLVRTLLREMVDEIQADDFQRLPPGGGNSPNWILGHLTTANLMGILTLGKRAKGLKQMLPIYGPGSKPTEDTSVLWSKEDLVEAFHQSADQLIAAAEAATPDQLNAPRDGSILQEQLPTVGDIVGHLLTTHIGIHVGQLSAWRRGQGMDSILQI